MKKLLALLLLSPFMISEDIESPVELTCINGTLIIYISLAKEEDDSWISVGQGFYFSNTNKKFKIRLLKEENFTRITGKKTGPLNNLSVIINNFTLASSMGDGMNSGHGQCYKGFKEYNEKQI